MGLKRQDQFRSWTRGVYLAVIATPIRTVPEIVERCVERGLPGHSDLGRGKEIGKEGEEIEGSPPGGGLR